MKIRLKFYFEKKIEDTLEADIKRAKKSAAAPEDELISVANPGFARAANAGVTGLKHSAAREIAAIITGNNEYGHINNLTVVDAICFTLFARHPDNQDLFTDPYKHFQLYPTIDQEKLRPGQDPKENPFFHVMLFKPKYPPSVVLYLRLIRQGGKLKISGIKRDEHKKRWDYSGMNIVYELNKRPKWVDAEDETPQDQPRANVG